MDMNHTPLPTAQAKGLNASIASLLVLCLSLGLAGPVVAQTPEPTDTIPPVLTYFTRASTGESRVNLDRHLNTDDTLTVFIHSSEPLLGTSLINSAEFRINGVSRPKQDLTVSPLGPTDNTALHRYSATYTVSDGDNGIPQLIITGVTDTVGNTAATTVHEIPEREKIVIDTTPPVITYSSIRIVPFVITVDSTRYVKARTRISVTVESTEPLLSFSFINAAAFRFGEDDSPLLNLATDARSTTSYTTSYMVSDGDNGILRLITYGLLDYAANAAATTVHEIPERLIVDTTRPTITLNGAATVTVAINGTYTDTGATIMDAFPTDESPTLTTLITNQGGRTVTPPIDTSTAEVYTYTYTAADRARNTATATRTVTIDTTGSASTDANLASLTLSQGTLIPAFEPDIDKYTASVRNAVASIAVTPTTTDDGARVTVNSSPVTSSDASDAINLNVGTSPVTIAVTAEDGTTTKTYTVTVTRAPAGPSDLDGDTSSVSLNDAKLLYYAYALGLTPDDTTNLVRVLGPLTSIEDDKLGDLLTSATMDKVSDLDQDGSPTAEDAAILYYSFALEGALGDGTDTNLGIPEIKKAILGPFIANPDDMDAINAMLQRAHSLRGE